MARRTTAHRGLALLGALALGSAEGGEAQVPEGLTGTVVVVNKRASTASFIDLASGRIVATEPTGRGPHELAMSSDGRTAVVTDYGGGSTLTVFDVERARRVATHTFPYAAPHGIAYLPGDSLVAVTFEGSDMVVVARVSDGEVVSAIPTQARGSHMLAVTGDGGTIWTGDMGSNTVTELSLATGARVRALPAPRTPEAVMVTPAGDRVFAGSNDTGRVTAWTTADGRATTVGEGFRWPYRIFLTPGVRQIVVPDLGAAVVRFFDGASYRELGSMDFADEGPQGLTLHPDGRHLFLSLSAADRIAVVDVPVRSVVGYLPAGDGPDGIGYSPLVVRTPGGRP